MVADMVQSGMVAIVGPPNAGKSTLMNTLLGQKISIVTPKPQTTRNRILGVVNSEKYQIVLIDTPGLHKPRQKLNKEMVRVALESLAGVDLILYMIDGTQALTRKGGEEGGFLSGLDQCNGPVIMVVNKTDIIDKEKLLPIMAELGKLYEFAAILPLSAKTGDGAERLIGEILKFMPPGPRYFPEDVPTDASERFLVGEIIREKVFFLTGQEIPYSTAVVIDAFIEETHLVTIHASIVIERSSQKGIIIGKGGKKLKTIGTQARMDIEKMLAQKVLLKLWVKVKKDWSQNDGFLREIGL